MNVLSRVPITVGLLLAGTLAMPLPAHSSPAAAASTPASTTTSCEVFAGERYCLGLGWTESSEEEIRARLGAATHSAGRRKDVERTGDLDAAGHAARRQSMSARERQAADRRELRAAARAVDKVRRLRALPDASTADAYPRRKSILRASKSLEQHRSYWCGPATAQAIAWGWRNQRQPQKLFAKRLGTTQQGTAITDLVRVVNGSTGYDRKKHAGDYVALDISGYSFEEWYLLMMRHIADYKAPVVLHPALEKRFYPYLDDDASGHFQVGRGYDKNPDGEPLLGYFEPWNQQRFDPSEPFIERNQWHSAYQQFRANKAHFQQNVGV